MNIEDFKLYFENGNVLWTTHCLQRMGERDISRADVKNCILNGEIIEDYPNDFPHPSCLVFGMTLNNHILHVVVASDGTHLCIITAYYPSANKFESDMKTRRRP